MTFKLFSLKNAMEIFNNVEAIRITNKKSRLLIMKDYVPIIGDIDGKLEVIGQNNMVYENVKGYYICFDNVFNFILEEI